MKKISYFLLVSILAIIIGLALFIPSIIGFGGLIACIVGFIIFIVGIVFLVKGLQYTNKRKPTSIESSNYSYPLSPKSVTVNQLNYFGNLLHNELRAVSKFYFTITIITMIICALFGTVILCIIDLPTGLIGLLWYFVGLILAIIFIYNGLRHKKLYSENTIEQLGQEKLNNYFEQLKLNENRAIDIPYYSECDELKSINFTPTVYARGGTFVAIEAADALIDEANGKFAVCTTYGDTTLYPTNVFEMSKVLVVSLVNNGETIYETKNQDGLGRAALGFVVAGGLGAMVGASTATTKTVAKKKDDLSVIITYNDLNRAYLTFKFGKDKTNAEQLYQIFTVVCKRNEG